MHFEVLHRSWAQILAAKRSDGTAFKGVTQSTMLLVGRDLPMHHIIACSAGDSIERDLPSMPVGCLHRL